MKTCTLTITSKTRRSLERFTSFFNKNKYKVFSHIQKILRKKKRKKVITILKSPHVNKKAQEQFEIKLYSLQFTLNVNQIFKTLFFFKKAKNFVFSDINIKIKFLYNKKKQEFLNNKIFNSDNFKIKGLLKKNFKDQNEFIKLKRIKFLNSNNLLKLFETYGNKL